MANSVRVRLREYLKPGRDANGSPVQNKELIVGKVVVTGLIAGGESLAPSEFGLESFDFVQFAVDDAAGGMTSGVRTIAYSGSAGEFYIYQNGATTLTAGRDYSVGFLAVGNSLRAPQFL